MSTHGTDGRGQGGQNGFWRGLEFSGLARAQSRLLGRVCLTIGHLKIVQNLNIEKCKSYFFLYILMQLNIYGQDFSEYNMYISFNRISKNTFTTTPVTE